MTTPGLDTTGMDPAEAMLRGALAAEGAVFANWTIGDYAWRVLGDEPAYGEVSDLADEWDMRPSDLSNCLAVQRLVPYAFRDELYAEFPAIADRDIKAPTWTHFFKLTTWLPRKVQRWAELTTLERHALVQSEIEVAYRRQMSTRAFEAYLRGEDFAHTGEVLRDSWSDTQRMGPGEVAEYLLDALGYGWPDGALAIEVTVKAIYKNGGDT